MLRLLICLFAIALPLGASAQQAACDDAPAPTILAGVAWYTDPPYPADDNGELFEQPVVFAAWRQADGPVDTTTLRVFVQAASLADVQAMAAQFLDRKPVRFTVEQSVAFDGETDTARVGTAKYVQFIGPVKDRALARAAKPILEPQPILDPQLGRFAPSTVYFGFFSQTREWFGKEVELEVALEPMGPNARERALAMARMVWNDRKAIDEEIREAVANHIYRTLGKSVMVDTSRLARIKGEAEPDKTDTPPTLSREEFKADHTLDRVACWARDHCELVYRVQRADWDYNYRGYIKRKGDGWYLDGWNFP